MKTGSIVIQFQYDDDEVSLRQIEKEVGHFAEKYFADDLEHFEAGPGSLMESFGIAEV